MGHRLTRIYTRTGDNGTTGLGDGTRVRKDHRRIEAFGTVDELNSTIGLLLSDSLPDTLRSELTRIQHELFDVGGELCIPGRRVISATHADRLEACLDETNKKLEPLKEFILPGGTRQASIAHLARTVCRRAERHCVALADTESVNPDTLKYLNRLSDLLFVLARELNRCANQTDVLWQPTKATSTDA